MILDQQFPHPVASLRHTTVYELLVAVILSAQCMDERVNMITPNLFPKYNTPGKMCALGEEKLKKIIKSCGFFNAKARNIMGMSYGLIERFHGKIPSTLEELITLPGVGRKTASVILTQWCKVPAVPVDTHVHRVANRLGLCYTKTPGKTEFALRKILPKYSWINVHLQIIFHGRKTCIARKPKCGECALKDLCEWREKDG